MSHASKIRKATITEAEDSGKNTAVELRVTEWTKQLARPLALKWSLSVLVCGLLSVFIPLIHFVSVPAGVLGAPVVYFLVVKIFSQGVSVEGECSCPSCQSLIQISESAKLFPVFFQCEICKKTLRIVV